MFRRKEINSLPQVASGTRKRRSSPHDLGKIGGRRGELQRLAPYNKTKLHQPEPLALDIYQDIKHVYLND
jgi:hypothetical protein